jgi:hypothetical protein
VTEEIGATGPEAAGRDPLDAASAALESLTQVSLERHPAVFARFDELLREALEAPPQSVVS